MENANLRLAEKVYNFWKDIPDLNLSSFLLALFCSHFILQFLKNIGMSLNIESDTDYKMANWFCKEPLRLDINSSFIKFSRTDMFLK